jgi:hypothetical protein
MAEKHAQRRLAAVLAADVVDIAPQVPILSAEASMRRDVSVWRMAFRYAS